MFFSKSNTEVGREKNFLSILVVKKFSADPQLEKPLLSFKIALMQNNLLENTISLRIYFSR